MSARLGSAFRRTAHCIMAVGLFQRPTAERAEN